MNKLVLWCEPVRVYAMHLRAFVVTMRGRQCECEILGGQPRGRQLVQLLLVQTLAGQMLLPQMLLTECC